MESDGEVLFFIILVPTLTTLPQYSQYNVSFPLFKVAPQLGQIDMIYIVFNDENKIIAPINKTKTITPIITIIVFFFVIRSLSMAFS